MSASELERKEIETKMHAPTYRPYVTTFTGKKIFIDRPDDDQICLEDIVHQTAMKCRFGGAVKQFYSVAQHSVYCLKAAQASGASLPTQVAVALHDANEGPYPDVQRPIKVALPEWKQKVEDPLEQAIYDKYVGKYQNQVDWKYLKSIDTVLLVIEARALVRDNTWSWESHWKTSFDDIGLSWENYSLDDIIPSDVFFKPWPWELAKARFKMELDKLGKTMVESDSEWDAIYKEFPHE